MSVVAIDARVNPEPHSASAITRRCCNHESNSRQPASAGVKTVVANKSE
jgi:hypothetical protein